MNDFKLKISVILITFLLLYLSGCVSEIDAHDANIDHQNDSKLTVPIPSPEMENATGFEESLRPSSEMQALSEYMAYYNHGIDLSSKGLYNEAIEAFNSSIKANESFSEAYFQRGMAYYSLGKQYYYEGKELPYFEKSVDDFTTSLQIDPSNPDSFTMRGWAYYWIGCYYDERIYLKNSTISDIIERGMNDCDNALKLDPNNVDALNCRALLAIHRVKGQFINKADPVLLEKAKNDIDTSLKINQTNPWTYFSLGYYYYLTSAPILSEEAFSEAISLDPDEAYFYLWRAKSRSTIDRYKAIEDNEKAIELQPRCALGYNNRAAQSSYVDEDFESRVTYFDKSIEIDPTNPLFYRNYAYSLWNLKYWDKQVQSQVIALFDKALELDPSFYVIHGDKALIYIYLNKNEESTQEILKFQIYAQTNEDFEYIQDILQYNGGQPWYYTHL